ncbi:hypothetical protein AAVH_38232, partial [Aphelenchoides avenae]
RTAMLAAACVLLGLTFVAVLTFAFDISDDSYIGHVQSTYGFGQAGPLPLGHWYILLLGLLMVITLVVSLGGYLVILVFAMFKRCSGKPKGYQRKAWRSTEIRLTVTCLLNFLPFAAYAFFLFI